MPVFAFANACDGIPQAAEVPLIDELDPLPQGWRGWFHAWKH
jgi:hypothetical protein